MQSSSRLLVIALLSLVFSLPLLAQESTLPPTGTAGLPQESSANLLFRDQFYLSPSQKIRYKTFQASDFLVLEQPAPEWNSNIALVSDFAPGAIRTRILRGIHSVDEAKDWIKKNRRTLDFQGVPIQELTLLAPDGSTREVYWVGNKSFDSFDQASSAIAMTQAVIEMQGGDFNRAVELAQKFSEPEPAAEVAEAVKTKAQFQKEEETALKWMDQLNIGESLYGPFQGVVAGEPLLYQSFGETTWRSTNLAERRFRSQVGFWTNRIVFKGIRFPINTLDPYVELTIAPETTGNEGGSQLDTVAGVEWRPLIRNAALNNFRPWGIPLLEWVKNYRFYVQYMNRANLKDEIANIRDFDLRFGVDIFYEWGIEMPPVNQTSGTGFVGLLTDYVWGEYFGNYGWRNTNFTVGPDFDAWILDTSVILGIKTPPLKLPHNPINDYLVLMPYFRFGLIANTRFSNPSDNRYFVAAGLRWMPFRDYRFVNNEWLFKTKIFAEWLGIGKVQNLKQDDSRPHPDEDWRIGVAWSLRRF